MTTQQSLFVPQWSFRGRKGKASARFSEDRKYRYELRRSWDDTLRPLVVVCCNPSIADEGTTDDPTCRRLYSFAAHWGFGGVRLFNIFALCSTDPKALRDSVKRGASPIGQDNDHTIRAALEEHREDKLLIAWGTHGQLLDRGRDVAAMALSIHGRPECFALTKNGQPWHPLYVPDVSVPHLFSQLVTQRASSRAA